MAADENNGTELAEEEEREDIPSADDKPISIGAEEGSGGETPNPTSEHEEEEIDDSSVSDNQLVQIPAQALKMVESFVHFGDLRENWVDDYFSASLPVQNERVIFELEIQELGHIDHAVKESRSGH